MGAIRRIYRRLRYGNRSESEIYLDGLRAMGVEIGRGTVAFAPTMTFLDVSRPWMLTIGENVQITKGVTVLTHGYDWAVLKGEGPAGHRGRILSKTQLLTQVWGYDEYDPNLVEVHVSALRRKLEQHGPRLIHTARGLGYVLRP